MQIKIQSIQLRLKHPFTTARNTSTEKTNIIVRLEHDQIVGWGEAAAHIRFKQTPETVWTALEDMVPKLPVAPTAYEHMLAEMQSWVPGQSAAKAALDMAVMDWVGKQLGIPLFRLWGLDPARMPVAGTTIGIDRPDVMAAKVAEAGDVRFLKVKLGTDHDRELIEAIRKVSDLPIRVDANEGWRDVEKAAREIEWLADRGVELIEQPLPADRFDDAIWLRDRSPLPLYADEAFESAADIPRLAEAYDGINIKLMKCGGTAAARTAIHTARALGMKIMLGCMIESALAISASLQLAPLVDAVDLDGDRLIADHPFIGHKLINGCVRLNDQPGLGVTPAAEVFDLFGA